MNESSERDVVNEGAVMQEQDGSPLASLVVPQSLLQPSSHPATAATSMLTIVPNDDEKNEEETPRRSSVEQAAGEPEEAIPPNTEPTPEEPPIPQSPQISLKFLLISGSRRVMSFDETTTVSRVKELVWNAWQSDWQEERPPTPSYLWIVHLGKVLQDDDTLEGLSFPSWTPPAPATNTIVHLWIRSAPPPPAVDESAVKKKTRRQNARTASTRQASTIDAHNEAATPTDGDEHGGGCCNGCIIC